MRGDLEWGSIPGLLRASAGRFGPLTALVDGPVTMDYAGLAEAVRRAGRAMMAAGLEPGDRVAMWAPNTWEWVVAALGALDVGGVLVPLNTRFKGEEAAYILDKSRARLLFTVDGFLGNDYVAMLRAVGGLDHLESIVVMRGAIPAGVLSWEQFLNAGDEVSPEEAEARAGQVKAGDPSDIIFTSGTTGRPKGAVITHGQSLRVYQVWSEIVGLARGDRYLIVNPFFHTFGYKAGFLACIMQGAVILPQITFDVDEVLRRIESDRITVLPGPPTLHQAILDHPDRSGFDLGSLRLAVTGAAVVPVAMIERLRGEMGYETVLTAYGLTESSGTVSMCRPGDDPFTIANTSGRAIPDIEVRVLDDAGQEVGRGQPGEIVVRGYNVIEGYFEDPDASAEAIDVDGWLHTGDIGVMDEAGYLKVTDRKKDMFIVGGFNAYPAEIENVLLGYAGISQAAVVGIPDDRLGEVGVVFVVARPGCELDPEAVLSWCRERMANFKVPRQVLVVDSLPVNAGGKVLKYELRAGLVADGALT